VTEQPESTASQESVRTIAWCSWHNGLSDTARLVQTGPDGHRFACDGCRESYRLSPLADQP
jgi:hypothetical protein